MCETPLSLLDRLQSQPNDDSWQRLTDLYTPLIRNWLGRQAVESAEVDDLVQETLLVVLRKLPQFRHNERPGAFRAWLRSITVNCLRNFWRDRRLRPLATGDTSFLQVLAQLEDPNSGESKLWDEQHDLHVAQRLLVLIKPDFEPTTWKAFERVTVDQVKAKQVAEELGISTSSVYVAKSRVLARLREESAGLVD